MPLPPPDLEPNMDNGNRAISFDLTEEQIKLALGDKNAIIYEPRSMPNTFVVSHKHLIILRCNTMGADIRYIEGGWLYASDLSLRFDEQEIRWLTHVDSL